MNPAEGGKGEYNCYIKGCVNLCPTKMLIYGQTLSKQDGGAKWLTIHKNLPRNRAQCMCSVVLA